MGRAKTYKNNDQSDKNKSMKSTGNPSISRRSRAQGSRSGTGGLAEATGRGVKRRKK
jgi:hypothetical protein